MTAAYSDRLLVGDITTATTTVITISPGWLSNGDFLILSATGYRGGSLPTLTIPSPFTAPPGHSALTVSNHFTLYISSHIAVVKVGDGVGELPASTTSITITHASSPIWVDATLEKVTGSGSLSLDGFSQNSGTGTTVTGSSISPATSDALLSFLSHRWDGEAGTPPTGMIERADGFSWQYLATQGLSSSGATGTRTMSNSQSRWWFAYMAAIKDEVSSGYEIDADGGSYALTGTAANLKRARIVAATTGSYSLTGSAANLERGFEVAANGGTYALSGSAAGLEYDREIAAGAGSYALTGTAAELVVEGAGALSLDAESGAYSLEGTAASLVYGRLLIGDAGSYVLAGSAAAFVRGREIGAESGSYALTGQSAALEWIRVLSAASGSYALSGQPANLERSRLFSAEGGSYALTGSEAVLVHGIAGSLTLVAETGSYALSGSAASLERDYGLVASTGSYSLSGASVSLVHGYEIVGNSGSYTILGQGALLERGYHLESGAGAYALSGSDAALVYEEAGGTTLLADAGIYSLIGSDADLALTDRVLAALSGIYALTGTDVSLFTLAGETSDRRTVRLTGGLRVARATASPRTTKA